MNNSLLPRLASSSLYPHLFNKISQIEPDVCQFAADQLADAGHPVHAATLQVRVSVPRAVQCQYLIYQFELPDVTRRCSCGFKNYFYNGAEINVHKEIVENKSCRK